MSCANLLMPGTYILQIQSLVFDNLFILSEPVRFDIISLGQEHTERTLLEWFDRVTVPPQTGIAWILWCDFGNLTGAEKRTVDQLIRLSREDPAAIPIQDQEYRFDPTMFDKQMRRVLFTGWYQDVSGLCARLMPDAFSDPVSVSILPSLTLRGSYLVVKRQP